MSRKGWIALTVVITGGFVGCGSPPPPVPPAKPAIKVTEDGTPFIERLDQLIRYDRGALHIVFRENVVVKTPRLATQYRGSILDFTCFGDELRVSRYREGVEGYDELALYRGDKRTTWEHGRRVVKNVDPDERKRLLQRLLGMIARTGSLLAAPEADTDGLASAEFVEVRATRDGKVDEVSYSFVLKIRGLSMEIPGTLWLDDQGLPSKRVLQFQASPGVQVEITDLIRVELLHDAPRLGDDPPAANLSRLRHRTRVAIDDLDVAIELFKIDHGHYPARLLDLVERPADANPAKWPARGYMAGVPKDAWEQEFHYVAGEGGFDLRSLGGDGELDGVGAAADIVNHPRK